MRLLLIEKIFDNLIISRNWRDTVYNAVSDKKFIFTLNKNYD